MKLVASMMVGPGELDRYVSRAIESVASFCDEVRIRWEGLGLAEGRWYGAENMAPVAIRSVPEATFFEHEGRARQDLLDWTLAGDPTHVLAIDADEFVSDGQALRDFCQRDEGNGSWTLDMGEVWKADDRALWTRQDGGWRTHPVPILYRVPAIRDERWRIQDRQLACGREPMAIRTLAPRGIKTGVTVYHFGWANESERQARYDRYAAADGGRFHASAHLKSILAPDRRVRLHRRAWPESLLPYKDELLERVRRQS